MYIDGRPKTLGTIAGFINSTQPRTTNKHPISYLRGVMEVMYSNVQ